MLSTNVQGFWPTPQAGTDPEPRLLILELSSSDHSQASSANHETESGGKDCTRTRCQLMILHSIGPIIRVDSGRFFAHILNQGLIAGASTRTIILHSSCREDSASQVALPISPTWRLPRPPVVVQDRSGLLNNTAYQPTVSPVSTIAPDILGACVQ